MQSIVTQQSSTPDLLETKQRVLEDLSISMIQSFLSPILTLKKTSMSSLLYVLIQPRGTSGNSIAMKSSSGVIQGTLFNVSSSTNPYISLEGNSILAIGCSTEFIK